MYQDRSSRAHLANILFMEYLPHVIEHGRHVFGWFAVLFSVAIVWLNCSIVQVLLNRYPSLSRTLGPSKATPLISAAFTGHTAIVQELLLSQNVGLLELTKQNGKNALHFAARQGHIDIVKASLDKDPQLAQRTDCTADGYQRNQY